MEKEKYKWTLENPKTTMTRMESQDALTAIYSKELLEDEEGKRNQKMLQV